MPDTPFADLTAHKAAVDAAITDVTSIRGIRKAVHGQLERNVAETIWDHINDSEAHSASGDLSAHEADTSNVHGIADTSALETTSGATTKVSTHAAVTTSVHGIADTSALETISGAAAQIATHSSDTTSVHGISDTSALLDTADIGVSVQAYSAVLAATTASFLTADETKLDNIEALADVTDAANVAAAGAVMESDTTTAAMSFVIDEDNMSSNSATKVPTQQSVKAYVDTHEADTTTVHGFSDTANLVRLDGQNIYYIVGTDNATTDATALTAARTALLAAGGGTIVFDGTLRLTSLLAFQMGSDTIPLGLRGANPSTSLIKLGGTPTTLIWGPTTEAVFPGDGRTKDAGANGTVVTISTYPTHDYAYKWRQFDQSATTYTVGQWLTVWSETDADKLTTRVYAQSSGATAVCPGELVQVGRIQAGSGGGGTDRITLTDYVAHYMTTLWIDEPTIAEGPFYVGDFSVEVVGSITGSGLSMQARKCVGGTFANIHWTYPHASGLWLTACANMVLDNLRFDGVETSGSKIAVSTGACRNVLIRDIRSDLIDHVIDIGAGEPSSLPVAHTAEIGTDRGTVVAGADISITLTTGQSSTPLNTHAQAYGAVFLNPRVRYTTTIGSGYACHLRSLNAKVINPMLDGFAGGSSGILIGAENCEVLGGTISGFWRGVIVDDTTTASNGRYATIQGVEFSKCIESIVIDGAGSKAISNHFGPPVPVHVSSYPYCGIFCKGTATGHIICNNTFERTSGTNDGAITQATGSQITRLMGNSFAGWGEVTDLESPGADFPFYIGTTGASLTQDTTLFAAWSDRNFYD